MLNVHYCCFIVAEKVIAMRSLSLGGATLTVKKATGGGSGLQVSGYVNKNLGSKRK